MTAARIESTPKPAPIPSDVSKGFWAAFQDGRLVAQHCNRCNRFQHYPKAVCVRCWGTDLEWRQLTGTGTVYTFSIVHRGPSKEFSDTPYAVGLVDLDEGVRMMTGITAPDLALLRIGDRVRVKSERRGETLIPTFERI